MITFWQNNVKPWIVDSALPQAKDFLGRWGRSIESEFPYHLMTMLFAIITVRIIDLLIRIF